MEEGIQYKDPFSCKQNTDEERKNIIDIVGDKI